MIIRKIGGRSSTPVFGPLYYLEVVGASSSGTDMGTSAFGFLNPSSLPGDGDDVSLSLNAPLAGRFNAHVPSGGSFLAGDVAGVAFQTYSAKRLEVVSGALTELDGAAFVYWYKNGTLLSLKRVTLTSPIRFVASVVTNTGPDLTITLRPTAATWTNAPTGAVPFDAGLVFLDENSGTVTNGGLTIEEGTVNNHTPYRTNVDITF
jgi:hypothetical protein